ncbi:MAG: hypothetical protein KAH21_02875 [Spirochaetaceae bacterium]|nr:hypothetical protein [Spirochaetaceae bacterium]
MNKKNVLNIGILILVIIAFSILSSCQSSKPSAGQLMMDVAGETFPIEKAGFFTKNHNFWVYQIENVVKTGKNVNRINLKNAEHETTSRAIGFTLSDPAGYEWDILGLAEMERTRMSGQKNKDMNINSYTFAGRMEEASTMAIRYIRADYKPKDPDFDGTMRGTITKENNEILYTFESNARLDTYPKPDDGLLVISIYKGDTVMAVVDSRNGYEVTFYEGLQPTERTQMATTISSLFVLMRYGIL